MKERMMTNAAAQKQGAVKVAHYVKFSGMIKDIRAMVEESKGRPGRQSCALFFDAETSVVVMAMDTQTFLANDGMSAEGIHAFADKGAQKIAASHRLPVRTPPVQTAEPLEEVPEPPALIEEVSEPSEGLGADPDALVNVLDSVTAEDEKLTAVADAEPEAEAK